MKTVEIIGYKRANLGKSDAKNLRADANVPCVLYGGSEQIHFYAPAFQFRELVFTDEAHFVLLNIDGTEYQAILQDAQYHPVSEVMLHADFLQLFDNKPVKMDIPIHFQGTAAGVVKGGTLVKKRRKLSVKALPKDMPEYINLDITPLDFGRAIKVKEVITNNFEVLDTPIASVAVVEIPRALKGKIGTEETEDVEEASEE